MGRMGKMMAGKYSQQYSIHFTKIREKKPVKPKSNFPNSKPI
jgi:hypothetical protein